MCPVRVSSWRQITSRLSAYTHAHQNLVRKLRDGCYDFKVVYRPGKTNVADALTRLNSVKQSDAGQDYKSVRAIVENCIP